VAHLVPVARWFGFAFGYCVAEGVALTACSLVGGPYFAIRVAPYLNSVLVLFAIVALARVVWSMWRTHTSRAGSVGRAAAGRAPAGLGTFAKSDSRNAADAEPLGIGA
jgi:hypothetical protein